MDDLAEVTMLPATTLVLSPMEIRHQVDTMREMQLSALTSGIDYGIVPGTDRPTLLKPGAELLLKAHGFGHHLDPVTIERDEHDRPYGVTYRCTVFKPLPGGDQITVATCDGYAGYDEARYYQSQAALEARERANAEKYHRAPNPTKWAEPYRAPWNTVIKIAQKRALVGATLQATATSGLFTQDVEDYQGPKGFDTPWWAELGFASEQAATAANDALRARLDTIPKENRQALRDWAKANGYSALLPVAAHHVEEYGKLIASLLDSPEDEPAEEPTGEGPTYDEVALLMEETSNAAPEIVVRAVLTRVDRMTAREVDTELKAHSLVPKGDTAKRRWTLAKELVLDSVAQTPEEPLPLDAPF